MRADAVLATNTSSLTLESLAATLRDPGHLVGLHFFNPVAQMPLVEVVHFPPTRPEVLDDRARLSRAASTSCRCRAAAAPDSWSTGCCSPTCTRRCTRPGEGIAFDAIDRAAVEFGMPMGPIELCDVVGLDVLLHVGEIVTRELHQEPPAYVAKVRQLVQAGASSGARAARASIAGATARSCGPSRARPRARRTWPTG